MKFVLALVATLVVFDSSVSAFSVQQHGAIRKNTALSMTTEKTETGKTVRVGVIGAGRIGLVHLEAITKAPGVIPVIISNPTVSKAEKGKVTSVSDSKVNSLFIFTEVLTKLKLPYTPLSSRSCQAI